MSVHECFEYVVDGTNLEPYIVISIQDSQNGFGLKFVQSRFCKGVLTLYFDDIMQEAPGLKLFTKEQALEIIGFLKKHTDINKVLIHCYAGESRSAAVASVLSKVCNNEVTVSSKQSHIPNMYVYNMLVNTLKEHSNPLYLVRD